MFSGSKVPGFKKAKLVPLFKEVSSHFDNCILRSVFEGMSDFTTDALEKRLKSVVSSCEWDWTNGVAVGSLDLPEEVEAPKPPQDKKIKFEKLNIKEKEPECPTKDVCSEDDNVPPATPFQVCVRLPTKKTATVVCEPSITVFDLKKEVNAKHYKYLTPEQMKLTLKKNALDNEKTLKDSGVKHNDLLMLKGPFHVLVQMPDGKELTVVCKSKEKAQVVREDVAKRAELQASHITLTFRGKLMDMDKTLKDQRIFSGDKLVASVREATRVTFLVSTYGDAHGDSQNMSKIILDGYKIKYELVDGALPEFKHRRDELFKISGIRGNYPQLFVDGKFIGSSKDIIDLNEEEELQKILGPVQQDPTQKLEGGMPVSGRFNW